MWYYYTRFNKTIGKWTVYRRWRGRKGSKPDRWSARWWEPYPMPTYYAAVDYCINENAEERGDWDVVEERGYYDPLRGLEDEDW